MDHCSNPKQNSTLTPVHIYRYSKTGAPKNYEQNAVILEENNGSKDYSSNYNNFQESIGSRVQHNLH